MKTLTFRDFRFSAQHALNGRSDSAAHLHWHNYEVRFWFEGSPDQDHLAAVIADRFGSLHGSNLLRFLVDSTDEKLADAFLTFMRSEGCVRVTLTNDGHRGAEVSL